ncbi:MAG: RNase adapter RapZ [Candidatus Omnitrophica bacterium]|nr:RNase adapter RapZ [Candidatus Omnitrophota bacterium]
MAERRKPHFVIITGLSGAGKNQALRCLEDLGFFCVDNLPTSLLITFAQLCHHSSTPIEKIALGIDIRERVFLDKLLDTLTRLKNSGYIYQILYLEASNKVLIRRFSETRRRHPLGDGDSILENLEVEKKRLAPIKRKADFIIDTTNLNVHELKESLIKNFLVPPDNVKMMINIISFGYKFGLPEYADLIFDVRFLPNPYYIRKLRSLSGRAKAVRSFVLKEKITRDFLTKLYTLLDFLMPYYRREGKAYLTVALGCTGGKHRSVVLSSELKKHFARDRDAVVRLEHRDIKKE